MCRTMTNDPYVAHIAPYDPWSVHIGKTLLPIPQYGPPTYDKTQSVGCGQIPSGYSEYQKPQQIHGTGSLPS